ncbi:MAG: selenocysteine-specific translation elongation factor [Candidatus Marinimicrobia bacterium]|nr:selenocysteine-specific translation elongation factor [Candidatus Neomarinimicrobiota bacterium]|tara:strand:- start:3377 stop:5254 length:1878 start_codon:yes stop_codon:yes gene_type:complete
MKNQIIVGMSGHIDHGKTSVVKSLTDIDTDILSQEKERGMTIDIGFAHLSDDITIVDVPGHEKFIKNMVTGVTFVDFAILVIAADDGVMPQTKEHFEILKILNVNKGVIVINKVDLVSDDWLDLVKSDIQDLVEGSFLEKQPIFEVSALKNIGISELKKFLLNKSYLEIKHKRNKRGLFRMYVDRVFSQSGFGTVVTGTVLSGSVKIKDSINVLPVNKIARLRSAETHYNKVEVVKIGDRAALNLHGVEKQDVSRGSHLSNIEAFGEIRKFIASIKVLNNVVLKQNQRLRFHIGASEVIGRISICDKKTVSSKENGICLIKLEKSVVTSFNDQFLVRAYSPMKTVGGGNVQDINCIGKWKDIRQYAKRLVDNQTIEDKISFIVESQELFPFCKHEIMVRFGMSFDKIIKYLDVKGNYRIVGFSNDKWIVTNNQINTFFEKILKEINTLHIESPYRSGFLKKELYQRIKSNEGFFDFCIHELVKESKIEQKKELIALLGFKVKLSDDESTVQDKIIDLLDKQGFCSQNYIEIANNLKISSDKVKTLIMVAEKDQRIIRINEELLFTSDNFDRLVKSVKLHFLKNDKLSISDFKNIAKTSRKYAVPLLEYFDKKKITYRLENCRKLV